MHSRRSMSASDSATSPCGSKKIDSPCWIKNERKTRTAIRVNYDASFPPLQLYKEHLDIYVPFISDSVTHFCGF